MLNKNMQPTRGLLLSVITDYCKQFHFLSKYSNFKPNVDFCLLDSSLAVVVRIFFW